MNNRLAGDTGELEVITLVSCPNCSKSLMLLPKNFPMYDIQCTNCTFRAQVKTKNSKPKNTIRGAGYDIYEKVLKAGYLAPPLIVNFRWNDGDSFKQKIIFYPFVAKKNIRKYTLTMRAVRANYKMFRYDKLNELPSLVLYEK